MIQGYPLSWPDGWRRIPAANRRRATFNRKERQHVSSNVPGGSGHYYTQTKTITVSVAIERVIAELGRMGYTRDDVVISTNLKLRLDGLPRSEQAEPADPGVAVYWEADNGVRRCMAIDRYDRVADNLAALAATLEAMRAIERHGGAEILNRAFTGFAQLPEQTSSSWHAVLGFKPGQVVTLALVEAAFRERAKTAHPDGGGSDEAMRELNAAREGARRELKAL